MGTPVKIRRHVTYANVAATLAVVIALTGTSYAAVMITGKDVKNSSLTGRDVKDSSLTGAEVRNGSLSRGDFKNGALPSGPRGPAGAEGEDGEAGEDGEDGLGALMLNQVIDNGQGWESGFGPFDLEVDCDGEPQHRYMALYLGDDAVEAQVSMLISKDDAQATTLPVAFTGDYGEHDPFLTIGENEPFPGSTEGHFYRAGGTIVLQGDDEVMTLVLDIFLDDRDGIGSCAIRGTETPST